MKQTKEELQKRITELEVKYRERTDYLERVRIEFAKAFSWYKLQIYGGERELRLPSWEEIFTHVGTLLAARNFYDFEGNISELGCKLEELERKIKTEIHPNL